MFELPRSGSPASHSRRVRVEPRSLRLIAQARVCELHPDQDFGCLCTSDGRQLYFHRNSVTGAGFDRLHTGDAVRFVERLDDPGLHASRVLPDEDCLSPSNYRSSN